MESWTTKKAEHWRIDAFQLWYWRRLLRVPWTARRSNLSILKVISPGCSLEGLMLKLKLQYFGHLMPHWERLWCWEGLGAGGEGDDRGWDGWRASLTRWTWVWLNSGNWVMDRETWRAAIHGVSKSRTRLSDWTELKWGYVSRAQNIMSVKEGATGALGLQGDHIRLFLCLRRLLGLLLLSPAPSLLLPAKTYIFQRKT